MCRRTDGHCVRRRYGVTQYGKGAEPPSGPLFPLLCGWAPTSLPRTDYIRVRLFRAPPPASPKWAATRPRPENIIPNRTIPPRRRLATWIGAERASIQPSRPRRLARYHRRGLCLFFFPLYPRRLLEGLPGRGYHLQGVGPQRTEDCDLRAVSLGRTRSATVEGS